jgi:hypothetical protein
MRRIDLIALGIGVALLAFGPLALTLARADDYHSTAIVALNPDNPAARYLSEPQGLLADPIKVKDLQRHIAEDVGWFNTPKKLPAYVHVSERGPGSFAVVASGPGATEAQQLADASAQRLRDAAEVGAVFTESQQLQNARQELKAGDLSDARRAELTKLRGALAASVREHEDLFAAKPAPGTLQGEKIGDRVLGALPGKRTFRPDPLWAGIAGLALAAALALWALALGPWRPRDDSSIPG